MTFKERLRYILQDVFLVFTVGAASIIGITIIRLLVFGSMKLTGETSVQLHLLRGLELIHFGWTIGVTLLFVFDSFYRLVILLYGGRIIEAKK